MWTLFRNAKEGNDGGGKSGECERNEGGEAQCTRFPGSDGEASKKREGCCECENDNVVKPRRT